MSRYSNVRTSFLPFAFVLHAALTACGAVGTELQTAAQLSAPRDPHDVQMQLVFSQAYELLGVNPRAASLTIEATPAAEWELDLEQWWKQGFLLEFAQENQVYASIYAAEDQRTIEEYGWLLRHRDSLPPYLLEFILSDAHGDFVSQVQCELDENRVATTMEYSEFFCVLADPNASKVARLTWPAIEAAVDRYYSETYGWELTRRALRWPGGIESLKQSSLWWVDDFREGKMPGAFPTLPEPVRSRIMQCWKATLERPALGPVTRLRMGLGIRPLHLQAGEQFDERARRLGIRRPRCLYPCEYLVGQRQTLVICQDELLWLRATTGGVEVVAAQTFDDWTCVLPSK